MLRRFGQLLALIAVIASVLIAQCALSCSMQALSRTATNEAAFVQSAGTEQAGHECCPDETAPRPTKNDRTQLCSDRLLTTGSVDVANAPVTAQVLHHFDFVPVSSSESLAPLHLSLRQQAPPDSVISRAVQAFFILRI